MDELLEESVACWSFVWECEIDGERMIGMISVMGLRFMMGSPLNKFHLVKWKVVFIFSLPL
jgi:hypothetical protein